MKKNKTPELELQKAIQNTMAMHYSRAHSERIKRGLAAKKKQNAKARKS